MVAIRSATTDRPKAVSVASMEGCDAEDGHVVAAPLGPGDRLGDGHARDGCDIASDESAGIGA